MQPWEGPAVPPSIAAAPAGMAPVSGAPLHAPGFPCCRSSLVFFAFAFPFRHVALETAPALFRQARGTRSCGCCSCCCSCSAAAAASLLAAPHSSSAALDDVPGCGASPWAGSAVRSSTARSTCTAGPAGLEFCWSSSAAALLTGQLPSLPLEPSPVRSMGSMLVLCFGTLVHGRALLPDASAAFTPEGPERGLRGTCISVTSGPCSGGGGGCCCASREATRAERGRVPRAGSETLTGCSGSCLRPSKATAGLNGVQRFEAAAVAGLPRSCRPRLPPLAGRMGSGVLKPAHRKTVHTELHR